MPLQHQKRRFDIPEHITYLNIASQSPAFQAIYDAGLEGLKQKNRPYTILGSDYFEPVVTLKKLFAELVHVDDYNRIATIPSVSYGMATVANNITLNEGDEILLIDEQFPSNYYSWKNLADRYKATIKTISPIDGECWDTSILGAITNKTAVVAMGQIHWSNGDVFDLKIISKKTKEYQALLIIDGSQSVGALPFSVKEIQPDALICAGYKWLFGPYGCAYAYFGDYFDHGKPLEENWSNRLYSENFAALTNYQPEYKPLANRYTAGESGNFIYVKMQIAALKQVIEWSPKAIQAYCRSISLKATQQLITLGCEIKPPEQRTHHLFGIKLPKGSDVSALRATLQEQHISVSFRGSYIRVSCHLFNTEQDFKHLVNCITSVLKKNILEEYIDIVDKNGNPTGVSAPKSEIHTIGHLHNTAHIWFFNSEGNVLLQQRAASKTICPLLWDVSVAGHIDAGETPERAAVREVNEEIGVTISEDELIKVGVFECFNTHPNGIIDNEFHHTYIVETNLWINDFIKQDEEVEDLKYVSMLEFHDILDHIGVNNHFVPSNKAYYEHVIEAILNKIT